MMQIQQPATMLPIKPDQTYVNLQNKQTPLNRNLFIPLNNVVEQRQGGFNPLDLVSAIPFAKSVLNFVNNGAKLYHEGVLKQRTIASKLEAHFKKEEKTTEELAKRAKISPSAPSAVGVTPPVNRVYVYPKVQTPPPLSTEEAGKLSFAEGKSRVQGEQEAIIEFGQKQPIVDGNPMLNQAERYYRNFIRDVNDGQANMSDLKDLKGKLDQAELNNKYRIKGEVDYISALQTVADLYGAKSDKIREGIAEDYLEHHFLNEPIEDKIKNAQKANEFLTKYKDFPQVEMRLEELVRRFDAVHGMNFIEAKDPKNRKWVKAGLHSPGKFGYLFDKDYAKHNPSFKEYKKAVTQDLNLYWPIVPSQFTKLLKPNHVEDIQDRWYQHNRERVAVEMRDYLSRSTPEPSVTPAQGLAPVEGVEAAKKKSFIFLPHKTFRVNRLATSTDIKEGIKQRKLANQYAYEGHQDYLIDNHASAIEKLNKAIELVSTEANYYSLRGAIHSLQKNYESALEDFNKAVEQAPNVADHYMVRGETYEGLKDYASALKDHNEAIRLSSEKDIKDTKGIVFYARGKAYHGIQNYPLAVQDFTKAIEVYSGNPNYYNNRGVSLKNLNQHASSIEDFSKALELKPNDPGFLMNRGIGYTFLGKFEESIEDFTKALQQNPRTSNVWYMRALSHIHLGNKGQAKSDLASGNVFAKPGEEVNYETFFTPEQRGE